MIRVLTEVENWALPILPVTAGELAAFVHDTVARTDPPAVPNRSQMKTVDEIVYRLMSDG